VIDKLYNLRYECRNPSSVISGLAGEVMEHTGVKASHCYQCGKCFRPAALYQRRWNILQVM